MPPMGDRTSLLRYRDYYESNGREDTSGLGEDDSIDYNLLKRRHGAVNRLCFFLREHWIKILVAFGLSFLCGGYLFQSYVNYHFPQTHFSSICLLDHDEKKHCTDNCIIEASSLGKRSPVLLWKTDTAVIVTIHATGANTPLFSHWAPHPISLLLFLSVALSHLRNFCLDTVQGTLQRISPKVTQSSSLVSKKLRNPLVKSTSFWNTSSMSWEQMT